MKRRLAIMVFALVGLGLARTASVEQAPTLRETSQKQDQSHTGVQSRLQAQRRDTWYEFLLKQLNPTTLITVRGWKNAARYC
jgi:opacity protein-like surface antigen